MNIRKIPNTLLFLMALAFSAVSAAAQEAFPYSNDFSAAGFPAMAGPWELDTGRAVLMYPHLAGGTVVHRAVEEVSGAAGVNAVLSTWFTVNDIQGTGNSITAGFGAFSGSSELVGASAPYYLVDWAAGGGGTGALRILPQPAKSGFSSSGGNAGLPVNGETYELRLTVEYSGGTASMTFAVFDRFGAQIGSAATATDTEPHTGAFFGLRNRTAGANHVLDLDYHRFSVTPEVLPPPDLPPAVLIEFTNLVPAPDAMFYPAANGLSFTVSTDPSRVMNSSDIELYINDELILPEDPDLSITGASPSFDVVYQGLETNRAYAVTVEASDDQTSKSLTWSFNTFDGVSHEDYVNDFYEEGFPFYNVDDWTLDTGNGIHGVSIGGGTFNRFATADLPQWVGVDFISSTWFKVNRAEGSGANPVSVGHVALANSISGGNYYLGYWGVAGGAAGTNGDLILLRTGGGNFTVTGGSAGQPEPGKSYELRLTGTYDGDGALTMTLELLDEEGQQMAAATATDASPLTGQFFGLRNRTAGGDQFLDIDHSWYSVSREVLPPPPPILVEFTNLSPAPGTSFHPAGEGLSLTVSTAPGNVMASSDIDLYLNGALVSPEDPNLVVTGASPSFNVSYSGLETNRIYTVAVVARDNVSQGGVSWSFNTVDGFFVQVEEDLPLNQSNDDDLQGLLPVSSFSGALPEGATLARITDAVSATSPTASVIPGPDDETVTLTWDLESPDSASYRSLTQIDVWMTGNDPHRTGVDAEFAVSNDGVNFSLIPGSRVTAALTYTGASLEIGGVMVEGTNTGNFNLLRYFIPPEASGFRYLRFISHGYDNLGEDLLRQSRIVEIDVFTIGGAPHISEVAPSEFPLFHPAGDGLQFTVSTEAPNTIDPADIELYLNGVAVSGGLQITGSPTVREVSFAGLEPDRFYTARAVVRDNERETTHVWRFDTLDESTTVVIEATDYNFAAGIACAGSGDPSATPVIGGAFIDGPLPSMFNDDTQQYVNRDDNGTPVGYVDRVGVEGIDFHSTATGSAVSGQTSYRWCEVVRTQVNDDARRPKFIAASIAAGVEIRDFQLHSVQTGEWWNYTRTYPEGNYRVLLRARASGGSPVIRLDRVTSDPSVSGQETVALGEFVPAATGSFGYVPLTGPSGEVHVSLSGVETLRLTATDAGSNIDLNYLVFVPAPEGDNFAAWIAQFDLPAGLTGPDDDADGDGLSNLVEYALGGHPGVASRDIAPLAGLQADGGQEYLTLAAERNPDAVGVTLVIDVSADLVTWFSGSEHTTVLVDTATELVVRDNQPISAANRRFMRLRVVED